MSEAHLPELRNDGGRFENVHLMQLQATELAATRTTTTYGIITDH